MLKSIGALALISSFATPVADRIPELGVEQSCRAVRVDIDGGRDPQGCLRQERAARDQLRESWSSFVAADQARCTETATLGGLPSYVELLTCLEMAKSARRLPKTDIPATVGRN